MISAKVILDSVNLIGCRLTTMEITCHRYIIAELNTHRAFSRNSASSRARSVTKTIMEVEENPARPPYFNSERKGMSGGEPIDELVVAKEVWQQAANDAVGHAKALAELGVHKSIVNRILEPFMWHTVIITATDWSNFFEQRLAMIEENIPAADPAMYILAEKMLKAYDNSDPKPLKHGQLHTPFITKEELKMFGDNPAHDSTRIALSVARCAGVSYLNHNTVRDHSKDLALFRRLLDANPPHWSPMEHVARARTNNKKYFNLTGWASYRYHLQSKDNTW